MKIFKKIIITSVLIILFFAIIPPAFNATNTSEKYDVIEISFSFSTPKFEIKKTDNDIFERVTIDNLQNTAELGLPSLPVKTVRLLLPYGYTLDRINLDTSEAVSLGLNHRIEMGHNLIPLSEQPADNNYNQIQEGYSNKHYSLVGIYSFRGYQIAFINLYPIKYCDDDELLYFQDMTLSVSVKESSPNSSFRGLERDRSHVASIIDNPRSLNSYDKATLKTINTDQVDYLIITNEAFKNSAGAHTFQDLLAEKESRGITTAIITVEEIIIDPSYWVDGTWGDNNPSNPYYNSPITTNISRFNDTQAQIRNFIRMTHLEWGTEYVLLGGDADGYTEDDNIVPLRGLYANETGLPLGTLDFEEDNLPSDIYYACLDGNFNYDQDEFFGEAASRNELGDVDEADLLAEIYVGRACVDSEEEISNFVMKTLAYGAEEEDLYHSKILMVGEYLGFPGISAYGANYKDLIIPFFPEEYNVHTLYDRDIAGEWHKSELISILNEGTPHLINHLGHGHVHYGLRLYNSDIASLTNDKYFFIYSQTCLAGSFDNCYRDNYYEDDCLAEYLTVESPNGAVAVIMNSRFGLGSEDTLDSPSQYYDESFYFHLLNLDMIPRFGPINHISKEANLGRILENGMRWVYYETNLFGDPELIVKSPSGQNVTLSISIVHPVEGGIYLFDNTLLNIPNIPLAIAFGRLSVIAEADSEPEDMVYSVEFFIDNESVFIDYEAPYILEYDGFLFGKHTITATVHGKYGSDQSDSIDLFMIGFL